MHLKVLFPFSNWWLLNTAAKESCVAILVLPPIPEWWAVICSNHKVRISELEGTHEDHQPSPPPGSTQNHPKSRTDDWKYCPDASWTPAAQCCDHCTALGRLFQCPTTLLGKDLFYSSTQPDSLLTQLYAAPCCCHQRAELSTVSAPYEEL